MPPFLIPMLVGLIPTLVKFAESKIVGDNKGSEKHAWVKDCVHEIFEILQAKGVMPAWFEAAQAEVELLIDELIIKAVDGLET